MIARFFVFFGSGYPFGLISSSSLPAVHLCRSPPRLLSSAVRRLPDHRPIPSLFRPSALLRACLPPREENGGAFCEKERQAILLKASSRDSTEAVTMSVLAPKP